LLLNIREIFLDFTLKTARAIRKKFMQMAQNQMLQRQNTKKPQLAQQLWF